MGKCGENIRERVDGRWEARVVLETPEKGKTRYKYLYGKTYQEVKRKKREYMRSLSSQRKGGRNAVVQSTADVESAVQNGAGRDGDAELTSSQEKTTKHEYVCGEASVNRSAHSDVEEIAKTVIQQGEATEVAQKAIQQGEATEVAQKAIQQGEVKEVAKKVPVQKDQEDSAKKAIAQGEAAQQPDVLPFREVCLAWLAFKKPSVKGSTMANYTVMVNNHILPDLGDLCVAEITSERITEYLQEKKNSGRLKDGTALKNKTIADLKAILKQILTYAQKHQMIDALPTCPAVSTKQAPVSVLTKSEQSKIETVVRAEDNTYSLGVILSLYGGLRIGEVCALRWEDFDFQNATVSIKRTISRIVDTDENAPHKTKVVITPPKTECSARTIPLPATAFQYIQARKSDNPNYVMTGSEKYLEPRVCLKRFKRLLQRADVANHTFHCLRHTFATRCIENGVDIKTLSEIMGHSDVKITMQRYVHPSMDFKQEQINKLPCFGESGQ